MKIIKREERIKRDREKKGEEKEEEQTVLTLAAKCVFGSQH